VAVVLGELTKALVSKRIPVEVEDCDAKTDGDVAEYSEAVTIGVMEACAGATGAFVPKGDMVFGKVDKANGWTVDEVGLAPEASDKAPPSRVLVDDAGIDWGVDDWSWIGEVCDGTADAIAFEVGKPTILADVAALGTSATNPFAQIWFKAAIVHCESKAAAMDSPAHCKVYSWNAAAIPSTHCVEQPLAKSDSVQFWMLLVKASLHAGRASGGGSGTPTSSNVIAEVRDTRSQKAASTIIRLVDCSPNITSSAQQIQKVLLTCLFLRIKTWFIRLSC
jgi:hypothetical protein